MGKQFFVAAAALLLLAPLLPAQDFILQGCYWSCPEDEPGSMPDSSTLAFWTGRMARQAPELSHAGFTYLWLPRLNLPAPAPVQRLLSELREHSIQPIAEIDLRADSAGTLKSQAEQLKDALDLQSFSVISRDDFSPAAYARAIHTLYRQSLSPDLLIKGSPSLGAEAQLQQWLIELLQRLPEKAASEISPRVYDYELREALRRASADSTYDVRLIFERSLRDNSALSGHNIVTLVNHPAYKNQNGERGDRDDVILFPLLAYAYILTNNQIGLPSVFYADYYGGASELEGYLDKVPLRQQIDQIIAAHREYLFNSTSVEYLNRRGTDKASRYASGDSTRVLIYQMDGNSTPAGLANHPSGSKDALVAINFGGDTLRVVQELNMANVQPKDYFTDILGQSLTARATVQAYDSAAAVPNALELLLPPHSYSIWIQGRAKRVMPSRVALSADPHADYIELSWEVAYERKVLGYELERSVSGGPYEKIGSLRPLGNGEASASYLFLDRDVFPNEALAYRVKILDTEGGYEYSPVKRTKLQERKLNFELMESEKPWEKAIRVISNYDAEARLTVFNADGEAVFSKQQTLHRGENRARVDLSALPQGVYFISFQTGQKRRWSTKVVKL